MKNNTQTDKILEKLTTTAAVCFAIAERKFGLPLNDFIDNVEDERDAQDAKLGPQEHEFAVWLAILTEELGKLSQAIVKFRENNYDLRQDIVETEED